MAVTRIKQIMTGPKGLYQKVGTVEESKQEHVVYGLDDHGQLFELDRSGTDNVWINLKVKMPE